jgi:hypothetical protein
MPWWTRLSRRSRCRARSRPRRSPFAACCSTPRATRVCSRVRDVFPLTIGTFLARPRHHGRSHDDDPDLTESNIADPSQVTPHPTCGLSARSLSSSTSTHPRSVLTRQPIFARAFPSLDTAVARILTAEFPSPPRDPQRPGPGVRCHSGGRGCLRADSR